METSALSFARPVVLNALWLLPLVAVLYWWAERRRRALIGRIVAPKLRNMLAGNTSPARRLFRGTCVVLALGLLIAALAGPQLGYDTLEVPHRGRDVIIAMDVSRSMLAPDVAPSRLERAKLLAEDLISELGADRVGLVAFAGSAFLQAPLTLDHGAVLAALDELDTSVIPKGGTNIAAAIRTATEAFGKAEGFSRGLIIISDGEELDADGLAAAKQAAADGIRVFTVGVGSAEGSEIPLGPGEFVRDPSGKVVQSKLDAARMAQIAEATGGFYTPLDADSAQRLADEGVNKLAESDITTNSSRRPIERYQWPLAAAIALLVLQAMVGERRRRPLVAAALWILAAPTAWSAPAGIAAYEEGDYEKAQQLFEERLKMEPDAPQLQLNAGTSAYRLKDYAKASQYFSRAMLAEDPALRSAAEFNLANTLFRQGGNQTDKEKTKADWKDAIAKYDAALKTRPDYKEAKENKEKVEQLLKELEKEQEKQDKQQQKNDQKQDQQKQDQQQQDQQKQDQQQQKDQQQSGGGKKQEEQQSSGDKKDQQDQGEQKKDEQQSGGGKQDKQDEQQGDQEKQDQQQGSGEKEQEEQPQSKDEQQEQQGEGGKEENEEKPEQKGEEQQGGQGQGSEQSGGDNEGEARDQGGSDGKEPGPVPDQAGEKKEGELRAAGQPGDGEKQEAEAAAVAEEEEDGKMSETQARALLRSLQSEEQQVDLRERRNFQDVSRDW